MTETEARRLANGVYELTWTDGSTSVAAVGRDHYGHPWYAPTNWLSGGVPGNVWHAVASAKPLTPVAIAPALDPTLRGLLLAALAGGGTAPLTDYLIEQMADPDAVRAVRENCARQCDDMARFYAGAGVGDGARYCARRIRSNAPGPFAGMNEADVRRVFGPPWPTL